MRISTSFFINISLFICLGALVAMMPADSIAISTSSTVITDAGVRVIAYPDGSWEYLSVLEGPVNTFTKPDSSVKAYKERTGVYELWYDPIKWKEDKAGADKNVLKLTQPGGLGRAEAMALPPVTDKTTALELALKLAKESHPKAELSAAEKILVNDVEVTRVRMINQEDSSSKTVLYGYCRLGKSGYVQVMTTVPEDGFDEIKTELDELLNGLVITKQ